ncbi:sensor histidine kinase [Nannocystis radixulma]|uniref:histidine kinase n=1 Tax=Nannocystis radixulma TaxID=2995305 RepID=A0ABT5BEQ2_9BACT|nr:ATP-binding protein [Nannocystis radixulma]MDC0672085.1 ATP-binding protein [Nannocystis radixulma]
MTRSLAVLVVDDCEEDAILLVRALERGEFTVRWACVDTPEGMDHELKESPWDVILCDCAMPRFDCLGALAAVRASGLDLPMIVVSGALREEDAVEALRAGARDFIVKGRLARLVPAVERELREAEHRRRHRATEARLAESEKLRALGEMAAGIAHDLRNIFTPLQLHMTMLRRHLAADRAGLESLDKIDRVVAVGAEVIERLSGFSRRDADHAAIALADVARAAVELCRHRLRRTSHVRLTLDESPAPPIRICQGELTSALVNLIGNALDAVADIGTVTVRTCADADGACVEVADDGPGIPPDVQPRVFEPFFTTKPEGSGLGLAIVRAFVERHGGRLSLETSAGAGTRVRMWFPACPPAQAAPASGGAGAASGMP